MVNVIFNCSFCKKEIDGYGNNPEPLKKFAQRCCDKCNANIVIPVRGIYLDNGLNYHSDY